MAIGGIGATPSLYPTWSIPSSRQAERGAGTPAQRESGTAGTPGRPASGSDGQGGDAASSAIAVSDRDLSQEERQQVQKLRQADQKVRAHEQAHLSAASGLSMGGASFQMVRGPDGKQYAVGGEVKIDISPARTPEQTIDKARRIQAAALAPADPSSQDRAVAAAAARMEAAARQELQGRRQESMPDGDRDPSKPMDAAGGASGLDRRGQEGIRAYAAQQADESAGSRPSGFSAYA